MLQRHFAERALRDICRVVVPASFGRAVSQTMLSRGQHGLGVRQVASLKSADAGSSHIYRRIERTEELNCRVASHRRQLGSDDDKLP